MVTVRLSGGLGNQMFRYAVGRAIAHRRGSPLALDVSALPDCRHRQYSLGVFKIVENLALGGLMRIGGRRGLCHRVRIPGLPLLDKIRLIRIDAEGAELKVLQGAIRLLEQSKPLLLCELHGPEIAIQVFAFLSERGYQQKTIKYMSEMRQDILAYPHSEARRTRALILNPIKRVNRLQDQHLAEMVLRELDRAQTKTVAVLGLAFTPNTPAITESPGLKLIQELLRRDVRVVAFDPLAIDNARQQLGSALEYLDSPERCLGESSVAVLTLRDEGLKQAVEAFRPKQPLAVIDAWRILNSAKLDAGIRYITLGRFRPPDSAD